MARQSNNTLSARMSDMVDRYGELCTHERAALILGVSTRTIRAMILDGRIRRVGHRVDVRSICDYIENPPPVKACGQNLRHKFFNAAVPQKICTEA